MIENAPKKLDSYKEAETTVEAVLSNIQMDVNYTIDDIHHYIDMCETEISNLNDEEKKNVLTEYKTRFESILKTMEDNGLKIINGTPE